MGMTFYHAEHYKPNGSIDRVAEVLSCIDTKRFEIVKASLVGSIVYGALKDCNGKVFAFVGKTSVDNRDYFNFGYNLYNEADCPCYYDCPKSILKLLSPTEDEWANEWRNKCRLKSA